jgi:hypothetical protein
MFMFSYKKSIRKLPFNSTQVDVNHVKLSFVVAGKMARLISKWKSSKFLVAAKFEMTTEIVFKLV